MRIARSFLTTSLLLLLAGSAAAARVQESPTEKQETSKKKKKPLPLKPARTLEFATEEGTWVSLDVSPVGTTLVFDLLGDLYTLPLAGGEATPLTHGMAFDSQPRFSPDGREVLFVSDRDGAENLWVIDIESKKARQITQGKTNHYMSPEWMPDGHYVVASKSSGRRVPKLWMWHLEGGSGLALIKEPRDLKTVGAAPTPDGRYLWFAQRTRSWQYNAILPQYQLALYDRETGRRYTRSSRFGSAFRPTLSPDGHWLAYGTRFEDKTGLRLRDLKSGEERWLAYPVQHDDQESVASRDVLPGMSFTPDSRELVASYGGKIWRIPVDGSDPIAVPFRVQVKLELGPQLAFRYPVEQTPQFTVRQIRDAVPSPDGKHLAFAALDRLYLVDLPAGTPRRLTRMEITEAEPAWSPDGHWIAYATWSEKDGGHLYKVATAGAEPLPLTSERGIYQHPAFSPDGTRVVAIRGPARAYLESGGPFAPGASKDIVWVPASGGQATVIAPTEGRSRPHFTHDPKRIYLYHGEEGLVSIRWDGSDEKHHVKVTGAKLPGARRPIRASQVMISPDGTRALAQVNNDLYVLEVPYVGGETPTISVAHPKKAPVPVRRLTDIGGQFPAWGADGRHLHWSIGNAHFIYDLQAAREAEERLKEEAKNEEESKEKKKKKAYRPQQIRIRIQAPRDIPRGVALLRGARVITMRGDEVIEHADLLIRDARIEAVGPRGKVKVPKGAAIIDVSGKTIIPGFVDTHAHLRPAFGVHKTQVWSYLANLAYGVTTTRDPQTGTTDVLSYSDLVEAGRILGPRIYSTGPGVFFTEQIRDLDHARNVLRRYSDYYKTETIKMYMTGNRQQRQWIIMAAREQKLRPTTEGGLDLKYNLTMMIDGYPGQEHSFPIYPIYRDVVESFARSGIAYTPTLIVSYGGPFGENYFYTHENPHDVARLARFTPHQELDRRTRRRGQGTGPGPGGWFRDEEYVFPEHATGLRKIIRAGGHGGVGSHGQLQGLGYHWELWMIQSGGLTEHEALRVATLMGAEDIGLDRDLGSIEPGKLADLIVLDRNPLENIRNTNSIRLVMKQGRLYQADTLDEIWPRSKKLGGLYWADDGPHTAAGIR